LYHLTIAAYIHVHIYIYGYIGVPSLCVLILKTRRKAFNNIFNLHKIIILYSAASSQINTMFSTCIPVLFVSELILIIYALGTIGSRSYRYTVFQFCLPFFHSQTGFLTFSICIFRKIIQKIYICFPVRVCVCVYYVRIILFSTYCTRICIYFIYFMSFYFV
jgi:hypothetical protein